jgi:hypothetical protein
MKLRLVTVLLPLSLIMVSVTFAKPVDAPITVTTTTSTSSTTSTTSTTVVLPPPDARCGQWWENARSVGFGDALLPMLDRVINRESRCDPSQINTADPNGGSVGLTQINRFWCLPSRYYPNGYLQTVGVLTSCDDLFDPIVNLRAAFALVEYSRSVGLCAWEQWAWVETPCQNDVEGA